MTTAIEFLESRHLFASAPLTALLALRGEINLFSKPIPAMEISYAVTTGNMRQELRLFNSAATDAPLMSTLDTDFKFDMGVLTADISAARILFGRDISHLLKDAVISSRKPLNAVFSSRLTADESLLRSQAAFTASTLGADATLLNNDFHNAVDAIESAHPIDATLATEAVHLGVALGAQLGKIEAESTLVGRGSVDSLIAAVDPNSGSVGGE